jgi:hypothetical protein
MTAEDTHRHVPSGTPVQPQQSRRPKERGRLWNFVVDKSLPLLAAILTLVAAVLGVWGARLNNYNNALANDVSTLKDQRSVLSEDNASLTADLADMKASRDSWKTRAEAARKTGPDTSTTPTADSAAVDPADPPGPVAPGAAGIFRQTGDKPVTIAASYGIDLDTRDVNWGVDPDSGDLYLSRSGSDYQLYGTTTVALVDHEATYDDCEAQTVLQPHLEKEQIVVGGQFCTKTSEGRWAYVKIIGFDTERGTITLHIVVWSLKTN